MSCRAVQLIFSPDGSRALRRKIELGSLELEGYVEARSGLLAGENLILPPHDGLEEGRRIKTSATLR